MPMYSSDYSNIIVFAEFSTYLRDIKTQRRLDETISIPVLMEGKG